MFTDEKEILKRGFVRYSDFGAIGDGATDDWQALVAAHDFANANGLPVKADEGYTYYVHSFDKSAEIKTDTCFDGARFVIDDTGSIAFNNRTVSLFLVARDNPVEIYSGDDFVAKFPDADAILENAKCIPWLKGKLAAKSLVRLTNSEHRDFIRFGSNVNSGNPRTDCLLVDVDGTIDESTPVAFPFEKVTQIEIIRTDDKPITISGGVFDTICCRVVEETGFENKWRGYYRNIRINRTNTTVQNIVHHVLDEPDIPNQGYGRSEDGKLRQSYPYYGILFFTGTYNSRAINCALQGHTTYYEDKTTSDKPVPQGTYDLVIEYSSHVYIEGITNGVDICDRRCWGLMSSNGAKNLTFKNCSMSRFDAHRGFWNASLINCEFGQTINVIGGGTLYLENVTRNTGDYFIALRGDYGATFQGDIIMKNCKMLCGKNYRGVKAEGLVENSVRIINSGFGAATQAYLDWSFGYTCYMPQNLVIDNFECAIPDKVFVFNSLADGAFDPNNNNQYVMAKTVTFKNCDPIPVCEVESAKALREGVKVINENV